MIYRKHFAYYIFLAFLLIFNVSKSQNDSIKTQKFDIRINAGLFAGSYSYGWSFYSNIGLYKRQISVGLGPIIGSKGALNSRYFLYDGFFETNGKIIVKGINAIVQYHPNKPGRVFDFYFQYWFAYKQDKDKGLDPYLGNSNKILYFTSYEKILSNIIGYGIHVKFLKHFYISPSFGIGVNYISSSFDAINDNSYDYNKKATEACFLISIGVGYKTKFRYKQATTPDGTL